jgi:hyperosmotically inducible protein
MKQRMPFMIAAAAALVLLVSCAQTDVGLTTKVKARLAADDMVKASQIEVTTQEGVVTLTGNVDSEAAKARALELARGTEGVTRVVDRIAARTSAGTGDAPGTGRDLGERMGDAEITLSVKTKLLEDALVKGLKIDVDTREGVVYLTGAVRSEAEKNQAITLARNTQGVRDVQANLDVTTQ